MKPLKLFLLATAAIFGRYSHSQTISKTSDIVLKDTYKDAFLMGVAVNPAITSGRDQASQDIVVKQFNSITVENVMKAALINPQPGVYNWGPADDFVAFGEKNKMFIVGHTWYGITRCRLGFLPMPPENPIQKKNSWNGCEAIFRRWPAGMQAVCGPGT